MNRAEKRRKERQIKKKLFLTNEELSKIKDEATEKAFDKVFGCLYALPLIVLKQNYGFGKKRLQKFNDELTDLLKSVEKGEVDLGEIMKLMESHGIRFKVEKESE